MPSPFAVPDALPWWRSKIIVGALVSAICKLLVITGVVGAIAPDDATQLTDVILLLVGGIGDAVAIGSRVFQRHAPAITAAKPPPSFMSIMALALLLPMTMAVAGCASQLPAPGSVASKTVLDEKAGYAITTAYNAASLAASTAIEAGLVKDKATIRRIGALDNTAYQAVVAVRSAYNAGNATDYATAITEARTAIDGIVAAIKGGST